MSGATTGLAFRSILAGVTMATLIPGSGAQTAARQTAFSSARWTGKTPDFRGIWQVHDTAWVNIEGHPAGNGIAAGKSIIVAPPDGNRAATSLRRSGNGRRTSELKQQPIRLSSAFSRVFPAPRTFLLLFRFFKAPATLPSSIRRIMPSAYSIRTRGLTSTAPIGGWATPVTGGRETPWLPTWSHDRSGMAGPRGKFS